MNNTLLLITPDGFIGILISAFTVICGYVFTKADKALGGLPDIKLAFGLMQRDLTQLQLDRKEDKEEIKSNRICIEKLEKELSEVKHLLNRRNDGNN